MNKKIIINLIVRTVMIGLAYLLLVSLKSYNNVRIYDGFTIERITIILYILVLVPIAYPKYYWTPMILPVVLLLFIPATKPLYYSIILSFIGFILYYYLSKNLEISINFYYTLLYSFAILLIIGFFLSLGYFTGHVSRIVSSHYTTLTGEAQAVIALFRRTIAYRLIIIALITVFIYKSIASIIELIIAWKSGAMMKRTLYSSLLESERRTLVSFEGTQYPVLDWGASLLLTLLIAPVIYPVGLKTIELILEILNVNAGPYTSLLASLLTTLALWPVMKLLVQALTKPERLESIIKPRPEKLLVGSLVFLVAILLLLDITGINPIDFFVSTIKGNPPSEDPITRLLQQPSTEYYRSLARILDLLVQLFWGG